ncbi:hypothetical protein J6590_064182 [Homalodisca vitripennis]|nr:hypothetical protein J6590_064182 [Homalodisca vitripennis]
MYGTYRVFTRMAAVYVKALHPTQHTHTTPAAATLSSTVLTCQRPFRPVTIDLYGRLTGRSEQCSLARSSSYVTTVPGTLRETSQPHHLVSGVPVHCPCPLLP